MLAKGYILIQLIAFFKTIQMVFYLYNINIEIEVKNKMGKNLRVTKYAYISYEKRLKIVEMVCQKGYTIQKTANALGINASTARMILKKYKDDGKIFERKDEQKVREITQQIKQINQQKNVQNYQSTEQMNWAYFIPVMPQNYMLPYLPMGLEFPQC